MTTFPDRMSPRYAWEQVEAAVLAIPLQRFVAALRLGLSEESGCRIARAQMLDDVRRELEKQQAASKSPPPPAPSPVPIDRP